VISPGIALLAVVVTLIAKYIVKLVALIW